jgi:cell division protein FtsI/penicillin-binding protein 2
VKNKLYKLLVIVIVACLALIFAIVFLNVVEKENVGETEKVYSEANFPLDIDLVNTTFSVGDKLSFTVTVTNDCGKDVDIVTNGQQPSIVFRDINDTREYAEISMAVTQVLKSGEKLSRFFEYEFVNPGTYILKPYYNLTVKGIHLHADLGDIVIEVK